MRASALFSEEDRKAVAEAVGEAERTTAGEIVPVVATISSAYPAAAGRAGLLLSAAALAGAWHGFAPEALGLPHLLGALLAGHVAGIVAARYLTIVRIGLSLPREKREAVYAMACEALLRFRVQRTKEATGLVLYVSVAERLVAVAGDEAVEAKLEPADYEAVSDAVLAGLRGRRAARGIMDGVRKAGERLARHFPIRPDDVNELGNDLRIVD